MCNWTQKENMAARRAALSNVHLFLLWLLLLGVGSQGGRVLVVPEDGSHWVNMEVILRELHSRGHDLTVVRSAESWYIPQNSPLYSSVTIAPQDAEESGGGGHVGPDFYAVLMRRSLDLRRMTPVRRFLEQQRDVAAMLVMFHGTALRMISAILEDSLLTSRLRKSEFDLVLTDPAFPSGVLLAHYLGLPMVYNVRWLNAGEAHMAVAPSPPSYVPMYNSLFSDRMDFLQRTENALRHVASLLQERLVILPLYARLLRHHFPPGADLLSMQRSADVWLMRVDFVLEFPRPTMPNVVYVGGFQCGRPQPLSAELEGFVQGSGEAGVVVMSMGTLVSALPMEITEAIATAFAQLPQRVVWRYLGPRPTSLGNNTLLLDWLPQNDLLGHPKTQVFVAHGGTNGLYEAIYHGVPILGLPLLFDQFDNLLRLQVRGAARVLEAASLTSEDFLVALRDVLENPSYRHSMQRLSRLHRDTPVSPLASATFWIEYVMRNKGAAHLRSQASSLALFSYHSLDVAVLFLALGGASLWAALSVCRLLCCYKCSRNNKTKLD
ncbi:UDP glucuronosyltransferase 5 family, polypeptide G1 [Hypomesus transpacificus]|uniref:UDP glucuronosyltransferase 5 family, polypeptide G1 n=1 Tax=Hypomesus transpacificus TaxID=137520 RepID=UPI001F07FDB1|nr:UDP glucuronosyltransferase 5 family, polypeptide G1 [Hypomesus transpacificus]